MVHLHLSLRRPDVLDKTVALGKAVQGIVGLAHGADEAAQSVDVVLAGDGAAGLVNLGDGDLDGGVVLGLDDAVGGRALAGDVAISREAGWVSNSVPVRLCLLSGRCAALRNPSNCSVVKKRLRLQVHDLATVVLHFDG